MTLKKIFLVGAAVMTLAACSDNDPAPTPVAVDKSFKRIATFPVCKQIERNCNTDTVTVAEIVAASADGNTLIYTDSPGNQIGFVDITTPSAPVGLGSTIVGGEPTSVAVKGDYVLVGVNTSSFGDGAVPGDGEGDLNASGFIRVVEIATGLVVAGADIDLQGQPDSVAVSPDGGYAVVAIENERNEDHAALGDDISVNAQLPAGKVVVVDTRDSNPLNWTARNVDVTSLAAVAPSDPEPEYVDINSDNVAVVTLQENNHIVLIDLATGNVSGHFSAGSVDLTLVDATEEDPAVIDQSESLTAVPREPDGVSWIGTTHFATADEGDMLGGSRTFTIFDTSGNVVFSSGNFLDHQVARIGHYPDGRSGNKGNESENIEVGTFGDDRFMFVNSERASVVFVYDVNDPANPVFKQVLPTALGPEGALAIASRNLLITASEEDDRGGPFRGGLNIYEYSEGAATYPTITSVDRANGSPIPWSAMSGLASDPNNANLLYAVEDSFYASNRIFTIDVSKTPAELTTELRIVDSNDVFAGVVTVGAGPDADQFDAADLAAMINADKTVNIDPEGIATRLDGLGFWVASEGAGTKSDSANRPINSLNFIFKVSTAGVIEEVITLPGAVNDIQIRFGFEGVAEYNGKLYVAFQREWGSESFVRIGAYDLTAQSWEFYQYTLDTPTSPNGGWTGLSDITSLGNGEMLVVERDNQGGPDARIKRLYKFSLAGLTDGSAISKTMVRDLMPDLAADGGLTPEKIEGSAVMANGDVYIINDNDGVDDNSGETRLINLGAILN